jgi:hypothetical protein
MTTVSLILGILTALACGFVVGWWFALMMLDEIDDGE